MFVLLYLDLIIDLFTPSNQCMGGLDHILFAIRNKDKFNIIHVSLQRPPFVKFLLFIQINFVWNIPGFLRPAITVKDRPTLNFHSIPPFELPGFW